MNITQIIGKTVKSVRQSPIESNQLVIVFTDNSAIIVDAKTNSKGDDVPYVSVDTYDDLSS